MPGNRCLLLDSLSPSRIRREVQHLGPFREGLCLCAYCEVVQIRSCALCASAHSLRRIRIRASYTPMAHYPLRCRASCALMHMCGYSACASSAHMCRPLRSRRPWSRRLRSCPHCNSGGGGSCRRQGKSAAPLVGPGVGCSLGPCRVESA